MMPGWFPLMVRGHPPLWFCNGDGFSRWFTVECRVNDHYAGFIDAAKLTGLTEMRIVKGVAANQ